ncbi:MAG: hypothetical protein ACJ76D_00565 [Solirubrobacterales bacterium]
MALSAAVAGLFAIGAAGAAAGDPGAGLAAAEVKVAQFESEMPTLQTQVSAAEARYRSAAHHAAPALGALRRDKAAVRRLRRDLATQEQKAQTDIDRLQEQRQQEADDHDEEVRNGVGFGLAALVAGLIALGWGFFRASPPVAALTKLDLGRAVGLCVGGGFLILIVGLVLGSSAGVIGAIGSFLFCLGLILPTTLLLARHSAEVQRGRAKPLLGRERLPSWVPLATAGLMAALFLASTGSAIFATGASSQPISPRLEEQAEATSQGNGAEELEAAQAEVEKAKQQAVPPLRRRNRAQRQLASARRGYRHLQQHLAGARSSRRSFTQRLVALEAQEQRELEKEEARALRAQEEQEEIAAEEALEVEEEVAACDYNPCLPPASDYDCEGGSGDGPAYTGTVEVTGTDIYGLDSDSDGIGCEP